MAYLDCRTAATTVEQAVLDALSLCYQHRLEPVATLSALAALPSAKTPDRALRFVTDQGLCYRFRRYSSNAELLPHVVKPADLAASANGRWERTSSTVTKGPAYFRPVHRVEHGYAKAVQIFQGGGLDEALQRIQGVTPAILLEYTGDDVGGKKVVGPYGALYDYEVRFDVWCISRNYRPQYQALWGSELPSEDDDTDDPGVNRMMGDIRYLFGTGCDLGLSPGVRQTRIEGQGVLDSVELDHRLYVGIVPLLVQASFQIPDEDLVPISEVWIQFQAAQGNTSGSIDRANHVLSGFKIPTGSGLAGTPAPGVAYVGGALVSAQPGSHVFSASMETYRWLLADGKLFYYEVAIGADPPAGPAGALLLGKTLTDSADITHDALLCDYLVNDGEPFKVGQD